MSQSDTDQTQPDANEQHIPTQYKIVDLPIIHVPPVTILKTFNCKIYRKVQGMQNGDPGIDGSAPIYEWKRKCYGKVRFVQCENGEIVVAAYQFGSCHLRMKEKPIVSDEFFVLQISQQYEFNWQFKTSQGQTLSISLSQQDFQQFSTFWNHSKTKNTNLEQTQVYNPAPQQINSDTPQQNLFAEPQKDQNPEKVEKKEQISKQQ